MSQATPQVALSRQRCHNHALREAAAKCPQCKRFFCRECVTEHAGRLICARCLRKLTEPAAPPRRYGPVVLRSAAAVAGLLAAWCLIYYLGQLLILLSPSFHEGTVWGP